MAKTRFKLISRHQDKHVTVLPMSYRDKATNTNVTLLINGEIIQGELNHAQQNQIETLTLQGRTPDWSKDGQKESDGHWINTLEMDYAPKEEEKDMKDDRERLENQRIARIHTFLRFHAQVKISGPNKENTNPNGVRDPKVELIDISKDILALEEKNLKIREAGNHLAEVYKDNVVAFIDILYAYGIPGIEEQEKQVLYNLAVFKLNNNPQEYLDLVTRKDLKLRSLVQQALNKEITIDGGKTTLITSSGNNYLMDGQYITDDIEQLYLHFEKNAQAREYIETKLGIMPSPVMQGKDKLQDTVAAKETDVSQQTITDQIRADDIRHMTYDIEEAMKNKYKKTREVAIAKLREKVKEKNPGLEYKFDELVKKFERKSPAEVEADSVEAP